MKNILITFVALITGFMALITSLLLAIPLAIAAMITGKRLQSKMKKQGFYSAAGPQASMHGQTMHSQSTMHRQYATHSGASTAKSSVIEGEYEDLSAQK
ncbi:MAG: hypothetical protein ACPG5L_01015 [Vibrio gallaecicus]|uniref:Uncharacterized protein n=1 Tax=Vibrio gallaecicus TaxID=552386 RepID=A0ABV4NAC9_9VIBR|nr:hypothetical protein [Vibrio gallaecicus]MDN3617691.1 hypothetical protein [Vibrio gallaecicus]